MAQYDELEKYDGALEETPESQYEVDSFGERIEGDEKSDDLTETDKSHEDHDGPVDNLTDKAQDVGEDIKEKFE